MKTEQLRMKIAKQDAEADGFYDWNSLDEATQADYLELATRHVQACKEAGLKFVNWHDAEFKEENGKVICEEQYKIEEIEI